MLTENEKYFFDLRGYLVIENAIDAATLEILNNAVDEKIAVVEDPDFTTKRLSQCLDWGSEFMDLMTTPNVFPKLQEIIGVSVRLDHVYCDIIRSGLSPIGASLHGGQTPFEPGQFYHFQNGNIYNGLTVVAFNLQDVNEGDGGFACVPGSHKSNLPHPIDWKDMSESVHETITPVIGKAGTAIIFTEALTHGGLPWKGKSERRSLFYKYSPLSCTFSPSSFSHVNYENLSDEQKAVLVRPQSSNFPLDRVIAGEENNRK
ncbi:MAG: phytanoyl-CoA dioxygenase family protein [Lentisphaeria bacterium]|nr:phytanoyl-CoA dioxygenase family protein [Lentisphaeria bacterium]NQZ70730.1 phytanoyl-CoA dioxygenase family protein [Lentisphaeria bacterium]